MDYSNGDWSVLEDKNRRLHIIRTLPNGWVDRICEIVIPSTGYRVNAEANAQLIASAPLLYEALLAVRQWAGDPEMYFQEVSPIIKKALSKAEGKEK